MKKVLFSLILSFILTGCFNYNELNDYAIVTSLAIDYKKDNYMVSLLISNSSKESNAEKKNIIYSGKGKTIYEALKDIDLISPKKIYLGHLSSVIISESSAKKGLYDTFELLLEDPQISKNFYIALAKDTEALEILKADTALTNFPSQYIAKNIESSNNITGSIDSIDFNSLLHQLVDEKNNPVINGFKLVKNNNKKYIKLDTLGIFDNDKLIGWASEDESKGINIINNKVDKMYSSLKCTNGNIIINIDQLKSTLTVKNNTTYINITGRSNITEKTCNINKNKIKELTNNKIKKYVNKAIILGQNNQIDLFGIKNIYYQKYHNKYKNIKNWNRYYQKNKFSVYVNVDIKNNLKNNIERIANEKNY